MQPTLALRFEGPFGVWGVKQKSLNVVRGEEMVGGDSEEDLLISMSEVK